MLLLPLVGRIPYNFAVDVVVIHVIMFDWQKNIEIHRNDTFYENLPNFLIVFFL
jgi:hypothetical protein